METAQRGVVPRALQDRLAADIRQALASPTVSKRFGDLGFEPASASGETFAQIIRSDYERWGEVIRRNKIRAE